MPGEMQYQKEGQQIVNYANAVLAMDVLNTKLANQAIEVRKANDIIAYQNTKPSPRLIDIIHDLVNAQGSTIKPGENFVVTVGTSAYEVNVSEPENGERTLNILKQLGKDTNGKLSMVDVSFPHIKIKMGSEAATFEVMIDNTKVFDDKAPYPGPVQRDTIARFGKKITEGAPQQLAIMGTGTGKSWVLAGVLHAIGRGVIVVPDVALANEMKKDAIGILLGKNEEKRVHFSNEFSVEGFKAALKSPNYMILIAEDPNFHEKAKLLKGNVVLMDESHQHTFNPASIETLTSMKQNNSLLGVTGTPTTKLKKILCAPDEPAMTDVNVRSVMDSGGLRQNYCQTSTKIPSTQLVETAIKGYFGRDEYLTRGLGVMSIDDIRKKIASDNKNGIPGNNEAAAINVALNQNRERGMSQKSFLFTGDEKLRSQVLNAYTAIAAGNYPNVQVLERSIQAARRDAEIEARCTIIKELHPDRQIDDIRKKVELETPLGEKVNLKKEIENSQRQQIANAVNTQAVALIFPKLKERDIEIMIRTGRLEAYINDPENQKLKQTPNMEKIDTIFPGLQGEQAVAFRAVVREVAERLNEPKATATSLCTKSDIDLKEMSAQYTASASVKTKDNDAAQMLDQLRTGLVMHVGSDKKFATGISITSVLGVQQIVSSKTDSLNNPVDAPQLHGRNIRANDRGAFNQQVVSSSVKEGEYVKLDDIYAKDSGLKMDQFFHHETKQESTAERFRSIKEQYETQKDEHTLAPDEAFEKPISPK